MVVPETTPDVVKARELGRRWPFLEIRDLLESRGVRVPKLLSADVGRGLLLVEDLGATLAERLSEVPAEREELYLRAVTDLCAAQRALSELDSDCIVRLRAFDYELLHWEIQHFREWGVEARGVALTNEERDAFDRAASHLARVIESLPRGFVHRDYQSRNLMVTHGEKKLAWIDFQDALLGPRAYDLVALLCDSYQPFVRPVRRSLPRRVRASSGADARGSARARPRIRSHHGPAQAQGRGPLRLHRAKQGRPELLAVHRADARHRASSVGPAAGRSRCSPSSSTGSREFRPRRA